MIDDAQDNDQTVGDEETGPIAEGSVTKVIVQYVDPSTGLPREVNILTGYEADEETVQRFNCASATSETEAYNWGVNRARDAGLLHPDTDTSGTQSIASSEASGEAMIPAVIAEGEAIPDRPNFKTANTQADASPEVEEIDLSHDRDAELAPEDRREVEEPAKDVNGDPLPGDEHDVTLSPNTQSGIVGGVESENGSIDTQLGTAGTQNAASPEAQAAPSQESAAASAQAVGDLGAAKESEDASHEEGVAIHNDSEKTDEGDPAADKANAEREDAKDRSVADETDNQSKVGQ